MLMSIQLLFLCMFAMLYGVGVRRHAMADADIRNDIIRRHEAAWIMRFNVCSRANGLFALAHHMCDENEIRDRHVCAWYMALICSIVSMWFVLGSKICFIFVFAFVRDRRHLSDGIE